MNFAKPELLAPAGDYTRFRYAVEYGADAVYVGGEEFSLRTAVANFPRDKKSKTFFLYSRTSYAISSAAAVGVALLASAAKSQSEKSVSCPIAEIIGVFIS